MGESELAEAERELSTIAANEVSLSPPPYDLPYLQRIHNQLFSDVYDWAGEIRNIDIAKGNTRFCNYQRIEPEANKLFDALSKSRWLEGLSRADLVTAISQSYGDLNVVHPFREGNGRAQRLLFEHLIINAGYQVDWWQVDEEQWLQANISAVACDYQALAKVFDKCIGDEIPG